MCVSYVNAQRPDGNREANEMPPHLGQTPRLVSIEIENVTGTSSAWARRRCRYRCKCTIKNNCTIPAYVLTNPNTTSNTLQHLHNHHHHHYYFNKIRSTFRKKKKKQYSKLNQETDGDRKPTHSYRKACKSDKSSLIFVLGWTEVVCWVNESHLLCNTYLTT